MTARYSPELDWSRDDAEAARPALETLVNIVHDDHYHHSMTELEVCEDDTAYLRSCAEAEAAYERWVDEGERDAEMREMIDFEQRLRAAEEELLIDWHTPSRL